MNLQNLFRNRLSLLSAILCLGIASCTQLDEAKISLKVTPEATETSSEIYATSATFNLVTKGIEQIAYIVVNGSYDNADDLAVMYADAVEAGNVVKTVDGSNSLTVGKLEGNTTYTICFIYANGEEFSLLTQEFTTPEYTRVITVIDRTPDMIKVHIEVPEGMNYKWFLNTRDIYLEMKNQFMISDYDFLYDGFMGTGPQTLVLKTGDTIPMGDPNDPYDDYPVEIYPGIPYVITVAECDEYGEVKARENEDFVGGGGGWGPMPLLTKSGYPVINTSEDYTDVPSTEESMIIEGLYARQYSFGGYNLVDSRVQSEITNVTQRKLRISCNSESDVNYAVIPFTKADYEKQLSIYDERGLAPALAVLYASDASSGFMEFTTNPAFLPYETGDTVYVLTIGIYDEFVSEISCDVKEVIIPAPTAPKAEITVTPIAAPEGADGSNTVWFNIKSPSKNVEYYRYLMNYSKEWASMETQYSIEDMLGMYGQEITDRTFIDKINSDEGYNIYFSSYENTESKIAIAAYNADELATIVTAVNSTTETPDKPRVESDLFTTLLGDWTATATVNQYEYNYETWTTEIVPTEKSSKVTISAGPVEAPASFGPNDLGYQGLYDYFYNKSIAASATESEADQYAIQKIAELHEEYKSYASRYTRKYRGQNRLVGCGFDFAHVNQSAWDLFIATDYSAVDTDQLFYDYGPKLFFEVDQDGKLSLVCDAFLVKIAPLSAWWYYDYVMVGYKPGSNSPVAVQSFPIELSEDKNSFTIKAVTLEDGNTYYPCPAYNMGGFYQYPDPIISEITFTRGYTEPAVTASHRKAENKINEIEGKKSQRMVRTRLPWTKDGQLIMPASVELNKTLSTKEAIMKLYPEMAAKYNLK